MSGRLCESARNKRLALACAVVVGVLVSAVQAAELPALQKLNFLDGITAATGSDCAIDMALNNRAGLDDAAIVVKGRELHLKLFRTYVHPPVRNYSELKSPCIQRVTAAQINPGLVNVTVALKDSYQGEINGRFAVKDKGLTLRVGAPAPVVAAAPVQEPETAAAPTPVPNEEKINLAEILAATPAPAPAAAISKSPAKAPTIVQTRAAGDGGLVWSTAVIKMAIALCVTLALLFGLVALSKRLRLPKRLGGGKRGLIRVVQTGLLDLKRRIAVVDVAGELIVVAVAANEITMLTKIESEEARRRILELDTQAPASLNSAPAFVSEPGAPDAAMPASWFGNNLRAYQQRTPEESAVVEQETLRNIKERVRGLKRL